MISKTPHLPPHHHCLPLQKSRRGVDLRRVSAPHNPSWPADAHHSRPQPLQRDLELGLRVRLAARARKPNRPHGEEALLGWRNHRRWEVDRQRSARVNRWELVCGCVSRLALPILRRFGLQVASMLVRMTATASAATGRGRRAS